MVIQANKHDVMTWHNNHYANTDPIAYPGKWQHFINMHDPYNTDNFITGYIQRVGGDEYGNLYITEVNDKPALQRITCTPKASYPYRRDRAWLLESAEWIRSALKYDGTNICQYSYANAEGERFTTYKLRTRPFVPAYFRILLDKTLKKYPVVASLQMEEGEAMIYELYGHQNPMLVVYPVDIELAAICRRNPLTNDMEPADLSNPYFARLDCQVVEASAPSVWGNIRDEYIERQNQYSKVLVETKVDGEKAFYGHEGEMLYVRFKDGDRTLPGEFTRLIKLKPFEIEEIHQASDYVPKEELEATVRNIFEVSDEPTADDFIDLLSEDWSESQIKKSMDVLERVLSSALDARKIEDSILETFNKEFMPEQFRNEKSLVMNRLGGIYSKQEIKKVYSILDRRLP